MAETNSPTPAEQSGGAATAEPEKTAPKAATTTAARPRVEKLPPYNVVLLDDDDHSYAYVIEMLGKLFGYDTTKAYQMAKEVDTKKRVIVLTTHKEKAELKRDQITAYGADVRMERSQGSMSAIIEPAEG
jgi:ATP-dependent Clp protease adaptor protein ClpS